jgi:hypothetical protein
MSNRRRATVKSDEPQAFWNGLPTQAARGTAVVADAPEFPMYWARDIVGQRIAVVWVNLDGVNYGGGETYLDDRDGSGWRKVTVGHGGPQYGHSDVAIEPGSFKPASRPPPDATGETADA